MLNEQLQKKVEQAIKLLKSIGGGNSEPVEVAYSGGKDSDVILQLVKESGIAYRAIYKNTTIDPQGTKQHAEAMGAEVLMPKKSFFQLVADAGFPNRFKRHCCAKLKEYKVLDKAVMGVRKAESTKRNARYNEPTECRFYGSKRDHVEAIYPILDWTDEDVVAFVEDRGIKLHPLYYREDGTIDPKRRLGCMGCPLASEKRRIEQFKANPRWVKAWLIAGQKFRNSHPDTKTVKRYSSVYEWFYRDVFFHTQAEFEQFDNSLFGKPDYKSLLEEQFGIDLTIKKK